MSDEKTVPRTPTLRDVVHSIDTTLQFTIGMDDARRDIVLGCLNAGYENGRFIGRTEVLQQRLADEDPPEKPEEDGDE